MKKIIFRIKNTNFFLMMLLIFALAIGTSACHSSRESSNEHGNREKSEKEEAKGEKGHNEGGERGEKGHNEGSEGGEEDCQERAFCKDSGQEEAWQKKDKIARENKLSLERLDVPSITFRRFCPHRDGASV